MEAKERLTSIKPEDAIPDKIVTLTALLFAGDAAGK
jgi:hypothetical protein